MRFAYVSGHECAGTWCVLVLQNTTASLHSNFLQHSCLLLQILHSSQSKHYLLLQPLQTLSVAIMVHLPAEILHQILSELYDGEEYVQIAPLATVNQHWQGVVEGILWRRFSISVGDIATFNAHFQAKPERRQYLRRLLYSLDSYFQNPFNGEETSSSEDSNESSDGEYEEDEEEEKEHEN